MKFVLRALRLPLVALCWIINWLALLAIQCGSYILSPVLWFIGVCCVYTAIKQQWNQTLLLLIIDSAGMFLFAWAITVAAIARGIATALLNL